LQVGNLIIPTSTPTPTQTQYEIQPTSLGSLALTSNFAPSLKKLGGVLLTSTIKNYSYSFNTGTGISTLCTITTDPNYFITNIVTSNGTIPVSNIVIDGFNYNIQTLAGIPTTITQLYPTGLSVPINNVVGNEYSFSLNGVSYMIYYSNGFNSVTNISTSVIIPIVYSVMIQNIQYNISTLLSGQTTRHSD